MARRKSTALQRGRRDSLARTTRAPKEPKFDPNPIIPPDVVLWAAEQSDYIGCNPWFLTSIVGMIYVVETVLGFTALGLLMFSATLGLANRTLLVTSFSMGYTSLVHLLGSMSSPFTDTYLPLSLYFFLFQLTASLLYIISGIYALWNAVDDIYAKTAAVIAVLAGGAHFLHLKRSFVRVFNQPED